MEFDAFEIACNKTIRTGFKAHAEACCLVSVQNRDMLQVLATVQTLFLPSLLCVKRAEVDKCGGLEQ